MPAINGDAIDESIFDNETNIEAAGSGVDNIDKEDEEDINPFMARELSEKDNIVKENFSGICNCRIFLHCQTLLYGDE